MSLPGEKKPWHSYSQYLSDLDDADHIVEQNVYVFNFTFSQKMQELRTEYKIVNKPMSIAIEIVNLNGER